MKTSFLLKVFSMLLVVLMIGLAAVSCGDNGQDKTTTQNGGLADKTALNAELALAVNAQGDYTEETYRAYADILAEAKQIANHKDATQQAVDQITADLTAARLALEIRAVEAVKGKDKTLSMHSGDSQEIVLADYVNTNSLSKITYKVLVSNEVLTFSPIADGKFTVTAGEVNGEATVKVTVQVYYDNAPKLALELSVLITNEVAPTLVGREFAKEYDMVDLGNTDSLVIDFAENLQNPSHLALSYAAKLGEEDLVLSGSTYTLLLGEYTEEITYKTFTVTVSFVANGASRTLTYTYKLGLRDTGKYNIQNGNFENGLDGWTFTNVGYAPFGGIDNKTHYWVQNFPMYNVGSYFSAYADGAAEASQGTLASPYFIARGEYATYMLGGAGNPMVFITIENKDGEVLALYRNTKFADIPEGLTDFDAQRELVGQSIFLANFVTYKVSIAEFAGQEIRFVVHDHASENWGVVFFDELRTYYPTTDLVPEGAVLAENLLANKEALRAELSLAIAEQGDYTADTYNAYLEKLAAAKAVLADIAVGQEAVDQATAALTQSRLALAVREVEVVEDADTSFRMGAGNTLEIILSDYVNTNGLSKITYAIVANHAAITVGSVVDGKVILTAGEVSETTLVTVSITVSYDGAEKLAVELTVEISSELPPVVQQEEFVKEIDLYDLENKENIVLDLSENIDNAGNLALTYTVDGNVIDNAAYTFTFGAYNDQVVYETIVVTVSYTANGEVQTIQYTYKLALTDSTEYRLQNGGFENGLNGWNIVGSIGDVSDATHYWLNDPENADGFAFGLDGSFMFSAYAPGAFETAVGTLTSATFKVGGSGFVTFKVGAMKNQHYVFIDVVDAQTKQILARYYNGLWADRTEGAKSGCTLVAYKADLSAFMGREVFFRISDNAKNDYGLFFLDSFETYYATEPQGFNGATAVSYQLPATVYDIQNGSFETGNADGWTMDITEAGAHNTLGWVQSEEINATWYAQNGDTKDGTFLFTFVTPADVNCESSKGTLQSSIFTLKQNAFIAFKFGGAGNGQNHGVYIELCKADGTVIATFYNDAEGKIHTKMNAYFYQYQGEEADCFLRVVDDSTGDYGCFVVDDFRVNLEAAPENHIPAIQ